MLGMWGLFRDQEGKVGSFLLLVIPLQIHMMNEGTLISVFLIDIVSACLVYIEEYRVVIYPSQGGRIPCF